MLSEVLDLDIVQRHVDSLYPEIEQGDDWEVLIVLKEFRALIAELRASRRALQRISELPMGAGHFQETAFRAVQIARSLVNVRSETSE